MAEESRVKEYSRAILFSAIGAPTVTYLSCLTCSYDLEKFLTVAIGSTIIWVTMWIGNSELAHYLSVKIPWVEFPIKRLTVGLISTVIFTVIVAWIMLKVWEYSWNVKFSSYYDFIIISLIITFIISLFLHGREFLIQWRKMAVEAERYQKESISARYESLKNQVNPHFLFNSLNVLTNLVYSDQDKATLFIRKMSEVYRYVLDTRNKELVDLNEEMAFTASYIFLQQIRFGENLRIKNKLDVNTGKVIPLAIQMLIENAIKHNEISSEKPLEIEIQYEEPFIQVVNKIQRRSNPLQNNSGVGLENIKKRYEFLCNDKVEITDDGEKFKVRIPLIPDDHDA